MAKGELLLMTDYKKMSLKELRKYILENRENQKAWDEFVSRPRPNAVIIAPDLPKEEQERILKELIG
jgi:hypothetical protein